MKLIRTYLKNKTMIMSTKENPFFIDKMIAKYQVLSHKEKTLINYSLGAVAVIFLIGVIYSTGEQAGAYLYNLDIKI
jgi:hypothetical protein